MMSGILSSRRAGLALLLSAFHSLWPRDALQARPLPSIQHRPACCMGREGQGEAKPFLTLFFCLSLSQKATDSGKEPEEEEENQMAGRPGHRHPQTAVRDLVTGLRPWPQ